MSHLFNMTVLGGGSWGTTLVALAAADAPTTPSASATRWRGWTA